MTMLLQHSASGVSSGTNESKDDMKLCSIVADPHREISLLFIAYDLHKVSTLYHALD